MERGFTIFEIIAAMALTMLMMAIAISNLKELNRPLLNGTSQVTSFLKQARAKALTTTSAYEVHPVSTTELRTRWATTCGSGAFTDDPNLRLPLPTGAVLEDSTWSVCFNSRGLADQNLIIGVSDSGSEARDLEVLIGGSVRLLP